MIPGMHTTGTGSASAAAGHRGGNSSIHDHRIGLRSNALDQRIVQVRQQDSNKISARMPPSSMPSRIRRRHADQQHHHAKRIRTHTQWQNGSEVVPCPWQLTVSVMPGNAESCMFGRRLHGTQILRYGHGCPASADNASLRESNGQLSTIHQGRP